MKKSITLLFLLVTSMIMYAQKGEITARELQDYVSYLASDSLKGRKPGTPEINAAATYILDHLKLQG
jgi:hypothetical protein